MSDVVISVDGLGKKYRLGANAGPSYKTVRESLADAGRGPLRKLAHLTGQKPEDGQRGHRPEFWALKDVNFEVKRGEVLGIIGRNGAGKSTLLKILSQITEPTQGEVRMKGRVASLLEVGTGFHPELTGRENVYLNGAILGMGKAEIGRKFDDIVAFAEVEKFIDTAVKHYSSGMYLRLAFSVAAHLEPEILVVDEVLAVGDAEFQKKCLGKMGEVAGEGRTVLFVSHNMAAISSLCNRAILMDQGLMRFDGRAQAALDAYIRQGEIVGGYTDLRQLPSTLGDGSVTATALWFEDGDGQISKALVTGQPVTACIEYGAAPARPIRRLAASIGILDNYDSYLLFHRTNFTGNDVFDAPPRGILRWHLPKLPLLGGTYGVEIYLEANDEPAYFLRGSCSVTVEDGDYFGTGSTGMPTHCKVLCDGSWDWRPPKRRREPSTEAGPASVRGVISERSAS